MTNTSAHLSRRAAVRAGLALGAAALLPPARACEFFAGHFTVIHPWTRATAAAERSAIVCMTIQDVTLDDRLIGVQTLVAEGAELIGDGIGPRLDLPIPAGRNTVLSEAGVHLRLVGLRFALQVGRAFPMNLFFDRAGAVRAALTVDYERAS